MRMAQESWPKSVGGLDLQELRTKYGAEDEPVVVVADPASEEEMVESGSKPAWPRLGYRRVHQAYVKLLLSREVGSKLHGGGQRGA